MFFPLILQALVENAIKHGLEPKRGPGHLQVIASRSSDGLEIRVVDDGVGLNQSSATQGTQFGVNQVRDRLINIYGGKAFFELKTNDQNQTEALLRLPLDVDITSHATAAQTMESSC